MRRECRERFPRHRLQMKLPVNDPGMHHGTCVAHVPWCMSGSLTRGGGENVPGIPGACTTSNFTYLARGPLGRHKSKYASDRDKVLLCVSWIDRLDIRRIINQFLQFFYKPVTIYSDKFLVIEMCGILTKLEWIKFQIKWHVSIKSW